MTDVIVTFHCALSTPPTHSKQPEKWELQKNEKNKKIPADIILQKCNKNYDQMPYCSWDMVRDKCNYFCILG